ncbi:hypothetical protein JCM11251_006553 [Rhodosporidiobolus azoricus]
MSLFPTPQPIQTFSDLFTLYRSSPSPSATPLRSALEAHLPLLVQQRTVALLRLQSALARFTAGRADLAKEIEHLRRQVETEVRLELSPAVEGGTRKKRERAEEVERVKEKREALQRRVEERYHSVLSRFEREWGEADELFQRWEVVLPHYSSQPPSPAEAAPRLASWLDALPASITRGEAATTIEDFLTLLLAEDPYILGSGIAMLSDLGVLLSPPDYPLLVDGTTPRATTTTPLQTLLSFLLAASGSSSVLELARGICETAVRELIGRERGGGGAGGGGSQLTTPMDEGGGIGLGIKMSRDEEGEKGACGLGLGSKRGVRETELEGLLVEVFEALDGLAEGTGTAPGPLAFTTRPMEDLLVSFLSAGSAILSSTETPSATTLSPSPPALASPSPPSSPSATWSPSAFLHTSLSTLASTPHLAYKTVTSFPGAAMNAFGLPTPPLSSPAESPADTASPKVPSSPGSPNKPLPRLPRSQTTTPRGSHVEESPLEGFLSSTATSLLRLLSPSGSSSNTPQPLAEKLLRTLLSSSFPPSTSQGEEHRKVLSVGVVRWWAFRRLGAFLRSPTFYSQATPSRTLGGAALPTAGNATQAAFCPPFSDSSKPFLSCLSISTEAKTGLLLPLHRTVYGAITSACGLGGASRDEAVRCETMTAGKAAEAFVEGWRSGRKSEQETEEQSLDVDAVKIVPLSPSTLQALFSSTAEVLLPDLIPPLRRGGRGSFKRGSSYAFGADEGEKGEEGGETLRERVEVLLRVARGSNGEEDALVYVTSPAGKKGGARAVSLFPPVPPAPSPPTSQALPTCLSPSDYSAVRRALHVVLSSPTYAHLAASTSIDLLLVFSAAASLAHATGEYTQHALLSRAHTTLQVLSSSQREGLSATLLTSLSFPLIAAQARSSSQISTSQTSLAHLSKQHTSLISSARSGLYQLEQLRRGAWAAEVTASALGSRLRERLREVRAGEGNGGRTEEELEQAREEVKRWKEEIGALTGFLSSNAVRDEALMLLELTSVLATEPATLMESRLYEREAAVWAVQAAVTAGEDGGEAGAGSEARGIASTILGAPAALLTSIPLPSSPFPHLSPPYSACPSPRPGSSEGAAAWQAALGGKIVLDSQFGAVSASLAVTAAGGEGAVGARAGDAYLADLASSLVSSLLYDLSSPLLPGGSSVTLLSDTDTDALLSLLSSSRDPDSLLPFHPLSGRPYALTPTGSAPPPYVLALLRRFIEHPDLKEKLMALVEVEKVLVEVLESGSSNKAERGETAFAALEEAGRGRRQSLSLTTSMNGLLAPNPDGSTSSTYGSLRYSLAQRRKRGSTSTSGLSLHRLWSRSETTSPSRSPLRPDFASLSASPPPPLAIKLGSIIGASGTWPRHRRGLSLPSAASGSTSGTASPTSAPAYVALDLPATTFSGGGGDGVSTDALLAALENAILHFLPALLPPCTTKSASAASTSTSPARFSDSQRSCGLFTTLHLLSHLSPSLTSWSASFSHTSSTAALEAKAFSDLAVACLAIKSDLLDGEYGVIESAWAVLGEGTDEGRRKARRLAEIALRHGAAGAGDLLAALG